MDEMNAQKGKESKAISISDYLLPVAGLYKSLKLSWQWRRLKWAVADASRSSPRA